MTTPWGPIQWAHQIEPGVVTVGTAGHGGVWLSEEKRALLPKHYKPFTGTTEWAEEDEDGALVLQYLGLLSLIEKTIDLEITPIDIQIGLQSRKEYYGRPWLGGPIVESFKRQVSNQHTEMICTSTLSPRPGGFKLAHLSDQAQELMRKVDAGENIEPTTVQISPYTVHEPKKFTHHFTDGTTHIERVSGRQAHEVLCGVPTAIENYIFFRKNYQFWDKTDRITHQGKIIFQR